MTENSENFITDSDRAIADAVAEQFDVEPDYEWSANVRRETQSMLMYMQVHGLSCIAGTALVVAVDHESYAIKNGWLTPAVAQAIADVRRLAWAKADDNDIGEALKASFNAVHSERMKPQS